MPNINLEAVLLEALDDERKAEATYGAVIEKFGEVRPFINIIEAERRHSAAIERQMTRLGFAIPANQWQGKGMAPATLAEACRQRAGYSTGSRNRRTSASASRHPSIRS